MAQITSYNTDSSPASGDVLPIVDISDLTQSPQGTTKKITVSGLAAAMAIPAVPVSIANGGTSQTSASAAFNALSPLTTQGDTLAAGASGVDQRVAGNTTTAKEFYTSTGTGAAANLPAWGALAAADIPVAPVVTALTFGASIAVNAALGNAFNLTLTASTGTLANPANPSDGQEIRVRITQDATGSRTLAFGTAYDFGAAGAPTLSTAAAKVDVLTFTYVASLTRWCLLVASLGF